MAANVSRSGSGEPYNVDNARSLTSLLDFSILLVFPYRLLSSDSSTLNVLSTLMLGLLIAWRVHHRGRDGLILGVVSLGVASALHEGLMPGAFGTLLPAALALAISHPDSTWLTM